MKRFTWLLYGVLITLLMGEAALRVGGYRPYRNADYRVSAKPNHAYVANSRLGIALAEGTYDILLNEQVAFRATHQPNGQRFVPKSSDEDSSWVAVLGCSFTYGYGVNDTETFVARLQTQHPGTHWTNHAVPGYGTVQACLQVRALLDDSSRIPDRIVVVFHPFHLDRNALTPAFRSAMRIGFRRSNPANQALLQGARFPVNTGLDTPVLAFKAWGNLYRPWPARESSALVYWGQQQRDAAITRRLDPVALTVPLLADIAERCAAAGVPCWVVNLGGNTLTEAVRARLIERWEGDSRSANFHWVSVPFDFNSPAMTNQPVDIHPDVLGHQYIADKLEAALYGPDSMRQQQTSR